MLMTRHLEMYTLKSEVCSDGYQCGTVKKTPNILRVC